MSLWKPLLLSSLLVILAACAAPTPQPPAPVLNPTVTLSPTIPPTPTATATPLPTLTPTPTAIPIAIADDLREQREATPVAQRGAPCGVVDFFDFPLAAPEGLGAGARWPFGRYSDRYSGIHAGEDWVYDFGSSLGKPVYAIGHGQVLYAAPLGWGVDKGTMIIRHTFADGRTIMSFYGHLDPPSVVLNAGDCVTRGQQIAAIGQPRGRPHLHFEIRRIFPDRPGPGYWSIDPTLAGWEPPSEYIWDERMTTAPGVRWTRVFTDSAAISLGLLNNNLFAVYELDQLAALDVDTGHSQWQRPISGTLRQALIDTNRQTIYVVTITGTLTAYDVTGSPRWSLDLGTSARSTLLPLPGGGVTVYADQQLTAFAPNADRLWQTTNVAQPIAWLMDGERLLFSTHDDQSDQTATYALDRSGQITRLAPIGGQLAVSRGRLFIYTPMGIYRVGADQTIELAKSLDEAWSAEGDFVAAYDGTLIVSHRGLRDRRLIALNPDGTLRWERSVAELGHTAPKLIALGRSVYAATSESDVLQIDLATGEARRVFDGGGDLFVPGRISAAELPRGRLLIDFRQGRLIALDPHAVLGPTENEN